MDRRELFEREEEQIREAFRLSSNCGQNRVVIVADTEDENARRFIDCFLNEDQVNQLLDRLDEYHLAIVFAIANDDEFRQVSGRFFPNISVFLDQNLDPESCFVLVVSNDGASVVVYP